ncbi:unnamed protein product [Cylindrotheca closterium]|uniref:Uncharacterized protein n=1 Tax=Cylindrotheca closterium TaxID=2856 RepID=A0AAD2G031_9STRA|nr:unnamed protein product [Cylindrotheca closterium]
MARTTMDKGAHCRTGCRGLLSLSLWSWVVEVCVLQSLLQHTEAFIVFPSTGRRNFQCKASAESSSTFSTKSLLGREEAQSVINNVLMPQDLYGDRIGLGRDAQGIEAGTALDPNDPRLAMTYAEFPLTSLDQLIDLGLEHMPSKSQAASRPTTCMIDLGSGCGRIGLYLAMTRRGGNPDDSSSSSSSKAWNLHGIEISDILHHEALGYCQKAVEHDLIYPSFSSASTTTTNTMSSEEETNNTLSLHLGPADNFGNLLSEADCIFAYSTVFSAKVFSPELRALMLGPEWSQMLGKFCKDGCVAITTDRALDPTYGWQLVDRLDVENREVFGTTGYVHILKKQ